MTDTALIKNNHIRFQGKDYFRVGSEDVLLGSFGEKKAPIAKGNYLEVQSQLPANKLRVRQVIECTIDFKKSENFSLRTSGVAKGVIDGVPVQATVDGQAALSQLREGSLKLIKLVCDNEEIRTAVNSTPEALERLRSFGNDARIAHQAFIVVDAKLARTLTASGTITVSAGAEAGGLAISLSQTTSGNVTHHTTVTLSRGSVFAYGLLKIDWKTDHGKKTLINKLTDDQWGLN